MSDYRGLASVTITSDPNGTLSATCTGNLTMAEVILGLELIKKSLMDRAAGLGTIRAPQKSIELTPRKLG